MIVAARLPVESGDDWSVSDRGIRSQDQDGRFPESSRILAGFNKGMPGRRVITMKCW